MVANQGWRHWCGAIWGKCIHRVLHKRVCPGSVSTPVAVSTPHPQILGFCYSFPFREPGLLGETAESRAGGVGVAERVTGHRSQQKGPSVAEAGAI